MASHTFSILVFIAFAFMFVGRPAFARKHHGLKKICSKTSNHELCKKLLKEYRSSYVDNREITKAAIELAYSKAKHVHSNLDALSSNTSSHLLRDQYAACSKNYHDSMNDLKQTKKLFDDAKYERLAVQVNDAIEEVHDCKSALQQSTKPSEAIDRLWKWSTEFELLCNVIGISSKYISPKYLPRDS